MHELCRRDIDQIQTVLDIIMNKRRWIVLFSLLLIIVIAVVYFGRRQMSSSHPDFVRKEGHTPIKPSVDCATVETAADDLNDGDTDPCTPLQCARKAVSLAIGKNIPENKDNDSAAQNLKNCLDPMNNGSAMIIGHGQESTINTGNDNNIMLKRLKFFSDDNYPWKNVIADNLGTKNKTSFLTLIACSAGAGDTADKFLQELRTESKAPKVKAPAKDVFCGEEGLYFEGAEKWRFSPAASLTDQLVETFSTGKSKSFEFRQRSWFPQRRYFELPFDKILAITTKKYGVSGGEIPLTELQKINLLATIATGEIIEDDGCPVARKLGRMTISFSIDMKPRTLTVFGNGLLHDTSQKDTNVYYRGSRDFLVQWNSLFK